LKTVTVSGPSPDLVQQAVTQINGLISEATGPSAGDMSENVECPPGIVGRIIGRGGETIRGLQQASGAHIVVNQVRVASSCIIHILTIRRSIASSIASMQAQSVPCSQSADSFLLRIQVPLALSFI
jgi:uncharacterized protein with PhoU and TrkA domain